MDKVKVAIRVRPFNRREIELCTKCIVEMKDSQTILHHHSSTEKGTESSRKQPKVFAFDNSFWSFSDDDEQYESQGSVYKSLGVDILDNAFQGYNACIFAYGQTGSGKSYTMMGTHEDKGIIPRLCDNLFERIEACNEDANVSYKVEVSYMEIYNEKVHDLLDPKGTKQNLRVREHNLLGPYVDGLSILAVASFKDIDNLMQEGNKSRTVAATNMNNESSRSHAVFNVILTQTIVDVGSGVTGEKVSKISLVDLAGSERAIKTGAVGERLKEGSNINKSLTTLGLVISKLADQSSNRGAIKDKFVPYRDSVLTWLLKDNLGGNSRTVMVATISPAADNYEESLSTLRYADRAKRIVNHAVVNEDPNAMIIRELRQEVEALKEQLKHAITTTPSSFLQQREGLTEKLVESEKLMKQMSQTWEEKLRNTEKIHQERQLALEKMGISVQASGIKVENNKYYLVNLNADPSLNELLVYYLKDRTLVGGPDASVKNDIQLSGLGIMPEHCVITLANCDLYIKPVEGARTCVNGSNVQEKTLLRHGDRVLWGNNHFFRVNCPKANAPLSDCEAPGRPIDYEFAREELMMNELINDPIQSAMKALERQHEEDKQGALEKQRKMYERQLLMLRNQMSPTTPYAPYVAFDPLGFMRNTPSTPTFQSKVEKWAQERDDLFKKSLAKLREDIVKANSLVREASSLAEEMGKYTEFGVTLQIPAANLSPNRKRGSFVSEPAILVKRKNKPNQVWTMDKLEMKLIDMRDMYSERRDKRLPMKDDSPPKSSDPFYESQENHNLIGVANVFLEVLFHDLTLNYHVPIISQQGEVAGRLQVEISRISGQIPDRVNDTSSEGSADSTITNGTDSSEDGLSSPNQIACRVVIKQATGLPPSLSNFVFCQYHFWGHPETTVVPPVVHPERNAEHVTNNSMTFSFDHSKDFTVNITEEFVEHCTEGALSIEVWGHRSSGFGSTNPGWELDSQLICSRSLADRWSELTRKIELRVEILELNDQGEYTPVEVAHKPDVLTGGIFQLRQGQQRRVLVRVQPVQNSGTLPIICESINTIAVGSVCARHKLQKGLDSYQEEDLSLLREKWSDALLRRRQYLDDNIQRIINKIGKTDQDVEREQSLIDQWVCLTEERNAVLVPNPKSGIPGAPADWDPPLGTERHIPVLFLDLNSDDMSTTSSGDGNPIAGAKSILPKEQNGHLFNLQIVKVFDKDVCAIAAWDSSIHDSIHLNRVTPADERVYLILKATVRLSHPATMQLVLRKRLCINVYKRQSLTEKLRRKINRQETLSFCSVTYEVVSNIPKASEELEDRESLAQIAASGAEGNASDGESYIEKYTRGVSAVESILTLDRLRQDVAVKELLAARGTPLRKTASVPNISSIMRLDASPSRLEDQHCFSESMTDVTSESLNKLLHRQRSNSLTGNKGGSPDSKVNAVGNSFGMTVASPQPTKLIKPMRTLMEEQYHREATPLLNKEASEQHHQIGDGQASHETKRSDSSNAGFENGAEGVTLDEDEFSEFESYQVTGHKSKLQQQQQAQQQQKQREAPVANGNSQLVATPLGQFATVDMASKVAGTPSMVSSGYGSQAVSSTTLSSDDSISIRSISVDETPDSESKQFRDGDKPNREPSIDGSSHSNFSPDDDTTAEVCTTEKTSIVDKIQELGTEIQTSAVNQMEHLDIPKNPVVVKKRDRVSSSKSNANHRASYPAIASPVSNADQQLETRTVTTTDDGSREAIDSPIKLSEHNVYNDTNADDNMSTSSSFGSRVDLSKWTEATVPEWAVVGESVLIRPYNTSGVIAFIGNTEFASGIWVGVDEDAPTGKNDGSVNGVRYFDCRPRHGIFVRPDKLILDKRGRGMRSRSNGTNQLGHSRSQTAGLSASMVDVNFSAGLRHSQSREMLNSSRVQDGALWRSKSKIDVSNRNNIK